MDRLDLKPETAAIGAKVVLQGHQQPSRTVIRLTRDEVRCPRCRYLGNAPNDSVQSLLSVRLVQVRDTDESDAPARGHLAARREQRAHFSVVVAIDAATHVG